MDAYTKDLQDTLRNRARLANNTNLLYWYGQLYRDQFRDLKKIDELKVLEIGSGVSPLHQFYATVVTSDVLNLDYLDHVFDCHQIDQVDAIPNTSLDVISLTNVLHHLKSPIEFLTKAAHKLKPNGQLIATEPYFSLVSGLIYRNLHPEPVDFSIEQPELSEVRGPLSSANEALAQLIFTKAEWRNRIAESYSIEEPIFRPFTGLSYFATGGISFRLPVPGFLYRLFFPVDLWASRLFPWLVSSFFTVTLTRRDEL